MRTFISRISQYLPVALAYILPGKIYAVQWASSDCLGGPNKDVATIQCLVPLFTNVVTAIIQLAGVGLFIMFIIGGFQFLTSGGDPKQLTQAKGTLTYAIIGVVVIVSAYLILRLIQQLTGVDVTRFTIPK